MNAILNKAITKAKQLSLEEQSALGVALLSMIEEPFMLDDFSRSAITEGLAQSEKGLTFSLEEVKTLRARFLALSWYIPNARLKI